MKNFTIFLAVQLCIFLAACDNASINEPPPIPSTFETPVVKNGYLIFSDINTMKKLQEMKYESAKLILEQWESIPGFTSINEKGDLNALNLNNDILNRVVSDSGMLKIKNTLMYYARGKTRCFLNCKDTQAEIAKLASGIIDNDIKEKPLHGAHDDKNVSKKNARFSLFYLPREGNTIVFAYSPYSVVTGRIKTLLRDDFTYVGFDASVNDWYIMYNIRVSGRFFLDTYGPITPWDKPISVTYNTSKGSGTFFGNGEGTPELEGYAQWLLYGYWGYEQNLPGGIWFDSGTVTVSRTLYYSGTPYSVTSSVTYTLPLN